MNLGPTTIRPPTGGNALQRNALFELLGRADGQTLLRCVALSVLLHAAGSLLLAGAEPEPEREATRSIRSGPDMDAPPPVVVKMSELTWDEPKKPEPKPEKVAKKDEEPKPEPKVAEPEPEPEPEPREPEPKPKPKPKPRKVVRRAKPKPEPPEKEPAKEPSKEIVEAPARKKAPVRLLGSKADGPPQIDEQPSFRVAGSDVPGTAVRAGTANGSEDGKGAMSGTVSSTPAKPAVDPLSRKRLLSIYLRKVARAIRKGHTYPRAARRVGLQGKAVVLITIDAEGRVVATKLDRSSGHGILDEAALEAARSVERVPVPPSALEWKRRSVRVPFTFTLKG